MKEFKIIQPKRSLLLFQLLFLLPLITLNSSQMITESKIEEICSSSDDYISNYFDESQELNDKYENYRSRSSFSINDDYIIKMLFLDKNAKNEYKQKRIQQYNFLQIIFIFCLILSFATAVVFDTHFLLRLLGNRKKSEEDNKKPSFLKFWEISSFCWVRYLINNSDQLDSFYQKYRKSKVIKLGKAGKVFFIFTTLMILIISVIFAVNNVINVYEPEKLVSNITCALMKFLYEIKIHPFRRSNYIGLDKIILFLNDTNDDTSKLNIGHFKIEFSEETSKKFSEWDLFLDDLDNKLGDQNGKEFYIESYHSKTDYSKKDIENVEKTLYQLLNIYKYHPSDDSNKILYQINNYFHSNADEIFSVIQKIYQVVSEEKENKESNTIYENIVNQLSQVLDIYIDEFTNGYLPNFHNILIKDYFSFLLITDYIYIGVTGLCCIFFIPLVEYGYGKKGFNKKLSIPIIFYNTLFLLLVLSLFCSMKIICVIKKTIYIEDLSKAAYYLFDKNNQKYLESSSFNYAINNINFSIKDKDGISKNIFYYLNYLINKNSAISDLYEINYAKINIQKISDLWLKLKNIDYDQNNLLHTNITNPNIDSFSTELSIIVKEGILPNTRFLDVKGLGFNDSGIETPLNYLSCINNKTSQGRRLFNHVKDFDCDETWNISTSNFGVYFYRNRSIVLDCETCINHYYKKNELNPPALLNFKEYSLEEIKERYSDLLDLIPELYYEIIYQFIALENFIRNDTVINQVEKLLNYNENLKLLQVEIFKSLKLGFSQAEKVISYFENLSQKYTNSTDIIFGDLLSCSFLKKDILFILQEIESSFIYKIKEYYQMHLFFYGMNVFLSIIFIIYYSLLSYEIPLEKGKLEKNVTVIAQYKKNVRDLGTQKRLEIYDKEVQNPNSSKNLLIFNSNKFDNINLTQEKKNDNNKNHHYKIMICEVKNKALSQKDILSLNKQLYGELDGMNRFFDKYKKNINNKMLSVVEEEKDEENSNNIDKSKIKKDSKKRSSEKK